MGNATGVVIAHTMLSPEALRGLAEEFVTRNGTDYGYVERTLEEKVAAALVRALECGVAVVVTTARTTVPAWSREIRFRSPSGRNGCMRCLDDGAPQPSRGAVLRRRRMARA